MKVKIGNQKVEVDKLKRKVGNKWIGVLAQGITIGSTTYNKGDEIEFDVDQMTEAWDGDTSSGSPYFNLRMKGLSHDDAVKQLGEACEEDTVEESVKYGTLVTYKNQQWEVVNDEDGYLTLDNGKGKTAYAKPNEVKFESYHEKLQTLHESAFSKRMDGLVNQNDLRNLKRAANDIRLDLGKEGFDQMDINDYIKSQLKLR